MGFFGWVGPSSTRAFHDQAAVELPNPSALSKAGRDESYPETGCLCALGWMEKVWVDPMSTVVEQEDGSEITENDANLGQREDMGVTSSLGRTRSRTSSIAFSICSWFIPLIAQVPFSFWTWKTLPLSSVLPTRPFILKRKTANWPCVQAT